MKNKHVSNQHQYAFGHPWHYYFGGDGVKLLAINKLPILPPRQPSKLARLFTGRTARVRLRDHVRREQRHLKELLATEEASYTAVRRHRFKALSELDRSSRPDEPKLAVAIAGAMLLRRIVGTRAEVAWCEAYLKTTTQPRRAT